MAAKINILATGVTGYIGGAVIERFLNHPDASKFNITALVRSQEKADKLKTLGIVPVIGSHRESEKTRKLASEADIVLTMADCDDTDAMKSVLQGLKDRFESTGKRPILINTSGTGCLRDAPLGKFTYETIYDDMNIEQIEAIPATQPHRPVDLLVVEADTQGYIYGYIILASTVYGMAKGRLVDYGIQNPHSVQVPGMIYIAIQRGQSTMVGEGKNTLNNVHIDDLADLYIRLYDAIGADPSAVWHGREGYYFAENGDYTGYSKGKAIAEALAARGIGTNEPAPFGKETELPIYRNMGSYSPDGSRTRTVGWFPYMGTSCRAKANRAKALGWKPVHPGEDMIASIDPEVEAILETIRGWPN